jgi:AAA+ superfamily predicted ATPase
VLFIDEVEEIAGVRQPRTASAAQGVTNEMLKLIPPFREQDEWLLICATNSVRALDSAFLRHGRFDYVIPVGPPDPAAREAIWDRSLPIRYWYLRFRQRWSEHADHPDLLGGRGCRGVLLRRGGPRGVPGLAGCRRTPAALR